MSIFPMRVRLIQQTTRDTWWYYDAPLGIIFDVVVHSEEEDIEKIDPMQYPADLIVTEHNDKMLHQHLEPEEQMQGLSKLYSGCYIDAGHWEPLKIRTNEDAVYLLQSEESDA